MTRKRHGKGSSVPAPGILSVSMAQRLLACVQLAFFAVPFFNSYMCGYFGYMNMCVPLVCLMPLKSKGNFRSRTGLQVVVSGHVGADTHIPRQVLGRAASAFTHCGVPAAPCNL